MGDGNINGMSKDNVSVQKYVAILGITLMAIKFVAWIITGSIAILTDAMESIVNVIAAVISLYALYLSAKPRDAEHPYGYGKVELISSSLEGMMIIGAGSIILFHSITHFLDPEPVRSLDIGLLFVAITAIANYIAGRFAIAKGKANRSMALIASGKHLCSDTYSSIGIVLGLLIMTTFMHMGYDVWWLDPLIASIFGVIIIVTGINVIKNSATSIIDRMDVEMAADVVELINSDRHDHWIDIHDLRIIKYGPMIHMEVHIVLPMHMTVAEQKREFDELKRSVVRKFGDLVDLNIMCDSCNSSMCKNCKYECDVRVEQFQSLIEWDIDTATDMTEDHSIRHFQ